MRPLSRLFGTKPRRVTPRRVVPRRVAGGPHDPAPSRLAYRWERLWLTPEFRLFVRVGLPVLLIVTAAGLYLGSAERRAAIVAWAADVRRSIEDRPEFMIRMVAIDGASPVVAEAVRDMLPLRLPESSFRIDLDALRELVAGVDAVQSAEVRIRGGGVLQIDIAERVPALLWRTGTGVEMLDATGHRVATLLNREARPDLPMIAGDGADRAAPEALEIFAAAGPLLDRTRGLVRMGERRWDLVLDRDQRIMLPEDDPVTAMARVIALDAAEDMLNRGLSVVDLRNPDRPTVRMTAAALGEVRGGTELETRVSDE